jgi:hypothetical protein
MIRKFLSSALCILLAPLLVAEQIHNDAQAPVNPDRIAATGTEPTPAKPTDATQFITLPLQSLSQTDKPAPDKPVNGQNAKANAKSKKHHIKKNISTALKRTGGVLAFIAFLPLALPFVIVWIIALLVTCRNGCDP